MKTTRKSYSTDVSDAEWQFLEPFLTLMRPDSPQREYSMRELFNALRYVVKTSIQWRMLPNDFPPWTAVYQQARRWIHAKCFEEIVHTLRSMVRVVDNRDIDPSVVIIDSRTLQSTPESGERAGYDGYKRKNGSKVHIAVDTLGNLLNLVVTPANEPEREQVDELLAGTQAVVNQKVEVAYADQGYTGANAAEAAAKHEIQLQVVKRPNGKKGFILLPQRWVVERTFAWLGRFRRLARDYERLAETLAGWHWVAAITLMLGKLLFDSA